MSKSKGNVVDPFDRLNRFGVDPLRYFLLKESSLHQDGGRYTFIYTCKIAQRPHPFQHANTND